ncbi:structural maintenance of chromosomes protein 2 [Anopheles cruzii]|uniref:structural maintenance of chromosomes protein 2 n=1 Tax=Anopheles cruzii TaxID=68878 RepID=UPI0022EC44C8|nr:structural maintenance of chromosomes protein 2 [Anopheles cruzii]
MYIKSIILDGFKSYGRRTEVQGFDPEFNAITGLNGTGKSNILDSICFVLGITRLDRVRAVSLQDLVYKSGQAGVTRATVTLVFDNSDQNQCPIGFENCNEIAITRQIMVGGKNKYLINGKSVQNKRVQDLFCSVQLNVNNPNFLIMQGRVTTVLNMKPPEIMSMIEEAAGTSMYESKRESAVKLIEKKQAKLNELYAVIREEIEPKLEKLKREREHYLEFQKVCRDIEYLTRLYVSYRYLQLCKGVEQSEKTISSLQAVIDRDEAQIGSNCTTAEQLEADAKALQARIDSEGGGVLSDLEEQLAAESKREATVSADRNTTKDTIGVEQRKLKNLFKSITDDEQALRGKETEMERRGATFQTLKDACEADADAFAAAQKRFEAVSAGLSTNEDGEAATLQDQLMDAKQKSSEAATAIKQSEMELKHSQKLLREKQGNMNNSDAAYLEDKRKLTKCEGQIGQMERELASTGYEEGTMENLTGRRQALQGEIRNLRSELDRRNAHRWELQYRDPEPGFDRSSVKGMVAKLVTVKDPKYAQALGTVAGGNLYSVITDTDTTSKKLLQKGQLQTRTTMIPLNKISSRQIDPSVARFAEELVGRENDQMNSQSKELKGKYVQRDRLLKQNDELRLEMKKKENEITKVRTENADVYDRISGMEQQYTWIPEDKEFFGVKNTRYDYHKEDPQEAGRKLKKLQDTKDKMGRNVNQKAMVLLEREEEQYAEVMRRKKVVEDDKKKIQEIITDLDEKKKKSLKVAWSQVDANFGSIFSSLLPGVQAKLVPPDGVDFMKGLEVKVGFNGMWKESLTELSGGQRSLVALSLILAMLKYKPAPLYILDEVDSALDLSHTQNIGNMLRAHFTNSQFIIVSLKDGMFNNANVLFRTRFIDGMSTVMRTVNMANRQRPAPGIRY